MILTIPWLPVSAAFFSGTILYIFIKPVFEYFYDAKNLRQYPNQNSLSGFTNLALVWESFGPFRTAKLYEAHKKHPIIRTGPTSLSFRDSAAIKDIYGHSSPFRKADNYAALHAPYSNMLTVVDKSDHARKRKMLSNAFATRNLMTWEYKVVDKVERLLEHFDKAHDNAKNDGSDWAVVDYQWWANLFTVAAICDIGLSHETSMLETGTDLVSINTDNGDVVQRNFIKSMHAKNRPSSIFIWAPVWNHSLRRIARITSSWFRNLDREAENFREILRYTIRVRMEKHQKGEKLDDFFHSLMEDRHGSLHGLDVGEIMAESSVILEAGSETTAIALTNLMHNLVKNEDKLALLRAEIDAALGSDEKIPSFEKVKHLPYLKACIDENLRMWPSITHGLARTIPPEGGSIMGHQIAGSVTVSIPTYVVHRDETVWASPEQFLPERWLDGKAQELQSYYVPFSLGARGCVGRNISLLEQHVLMAALVKRYDFELEDENWVLDREEALVCWTGRLPVKLRRRSERES